MRRLMKQSFLGVSIVLLVFCMAAPAHAQYCEQDCAVQNSGAGACGDYPRCDMGCNAGGGNYTTCGDAGYGCVSTYPQVTNVRGEHSNRYAPYICEVRAWVDKQLVDSCPAGTFAHPGTWCEEIHSGWAGTSEAFSDCCDTGGCWGQNYC